MLRHSASILAATFSLAASVPAVAQQSAGGSTAPTIAVAAVRLENGYRASRIIGASVYNAQNDQVGTVSDLFLSRQNQIAMAVISVNSFLGIGGKLVVVPFDKLQIAEGNKVVMAGGTKEELNGMPNVEYDK